MADISKITLPSGTTYDIKDAVARALISSGVTFIVAWDGISAPDAALIPAGIIVTYNGNNITGTLSTTSGTSGAFYLVKSSTNPSQDILDIYDEYVIVKPDTRDNTTWFWEKIGDTKVNLTDVVTNIVLNKQTDTVIGADSTFTITQPTINLTANTSTDTGRITYIQSQGTAQTTKLSATAADGATAWNNKDEKTVITGYASPTTESFVKSVSPSTSKLTTTTVTGVSGSTTASKAAAATSQTTISGVANSTNNSDLLANISVSNEVLTIGAKSLNTQTTTQFTFTDVTVPTADESATTVATGAVASNSSGASIVTGVAVGDSANALTGLGAASTASVIGASSTFSNTQPTITVASGATGDVTVATGIGAATTRYLSATASGAKTEWDNKDTVTTLTNGTSLTVTKGN